MRSITRFPSPPRPRRAIALGLLGTALALAGAGTASAAASGPGTSQAGSVTHQLTTPRGATRHISGHATLTAAASPAHGAHGARRSLNSWDAIIHAAADQASGPLPASERLLPGPVSGPQSNLPMTPAREANAATIVRQALRMHMGLRSAVIAVATAIQESTLLNIDYGTYDSLGLFQQQPDMGWGTPAQVTDPTYASDAFLTALRQYQAGTPGWATQPLWEAAQGVQNSGYPYAYAKWEDQAAHIVANAARGMV